jgi:hypothetical protein
MLSTAGFPIRNFDLLHVAPSSVHAGGMHAFPPAEDLQFLVGDEIIQIALDPYSTQFRFARGSKILVEGEIEHIDASGLSHSYDCIARSAGALYLHQLLQHPISVVEVEPLALSLIFTNRAVLRIYSELGPYECGQIYTDQGLSSSEFISRGAHHFALAFLSVLDEYG